MLLMLMNMMKKLTHLFMKGTMYLKTFLKHQRKLDQPITTPNGTITQNGKFYTAAQSYKMKMIEHPHKVKVYEKIRDGIWCYKGFFSLVDATFVSDGTRNVFKFYLLPVVVKSFQKEIEIPHTRLIPTDVKVAVWARDKGQCVLCGSKENLHFDHDLPFSKGGTSLTAENVKILCMKHNLKKSNKLLTIPPIFLS